MAGKGGGRRGTPKRDGGGRGAGGKKEGMVKTSLLIDPARHHELECVASHTRRTQNQIIIEALDAHLGKFAVVQWMRRSQGSPDVAQGLSNDQPADASSGPGLPPTQAA